MIQAKNCLVVLFIVGYTRAQTTCGGAGATCKDSSFADICTCPAGTACAPGAGGSFCQYTFCLPDSMMCSGNIGTCCSGKCETKAGETLATCTAATTTTTTTHTHTHTHTWNHIPDLLSLHLNAFPEMIRKS